MKQEEDDDGAQRERERVVSEDEPGYNSLPICTHLVQPKLICDLQVGPADQCREAAVGSGHILCIFLYVHVPFCEESRNPYTSELSPSCGKSHSVFFPAYPTLKLSFDEFWDIANNI